MSDITIEATANANAKVVTLEPGTLAVIDTFEIEKGTTVVADIKIAAMNPFHGNQPKFVPEGYTWVPGLAPSEELNNVYYEMVGRHDKAIQKAIIKSGRFNWATYGMWYRGEMVDRGVPYIARIIDRLVEGKSVVIAAPFANFDHHYLNVLQEIIAAEAASVQGCRTETEPSEEEQASDTE
jgi:hypothetical protein